MGFPVVTNFSLISNLNLLWHKLGLFLLALSFVHHPILPQKQVSASKEQQRGGGRET